MTSSFALAADCPRMIQREGREIKSVLQSELSTTECQKEGKDQRVRNQGEVEQHQVQNQA